MADPQITIIDSGLRDSDGRVIPIGLEGDYSGSQYAGVYNQLDGIRRELLNSGLLTEGFEKYMKSDVYGVDIFNLFNKPKGVKGNILTGDRVEVWNEEQLSKITENQIPVFKMQNGKWQLTDINIGEPAQQAKSDVLLSMDIMANPDAVKEYKARKQRQDAPLETREGQLLTTQQLPVPPQTPKAAGITGASVEDWMKLGFTEAEAEEKVRQGTPYVKANVGSLADTPLAGEWDDFATINPSDLRASYYGQDIKDAAGNVTVQQGPVGTMGGTWAPQTVEELKKQGYSEEEALAFQQESLAQAQKMFPQQFPLDMTVEEAQKQAQMQGMAGSGMPNVGAMGAGALGMNPDLQSLQWAGLPTYDYAGALPYALPYAGNPLIGTVYQDVVPKYKQAYDMAQLLGVVQADPQALAGQTGTIGFQQFMQSNPDVRGLLGSGLDAIDAVKSKLSTGLLPSALSDNEQYIYENYIAPRPNDPLGGVQQELALRQSLTDYLPEAVRGAARAGLARQYQEAVATNPISLFEGQSLNRFSPYQTTDPLAFTPTPQGGTPPMPPMSTNTMRAPMASPMDLPPQPPSPTTDTSEQVTVAAASTAPPQAQQTPDDIQTFNAEVFKRIAPAAPTVEQYTKSPASYPNYTLSNTGKVIPNEGRDAEYWEQRAVEDDPAAAGLVPRYDAYDENKIIGWDRLGVDPEGIQKKVQTWVDREGNIQNRVVGGEEARLMKKSGFMDPKGINPALGVPAIAAATPGNVPMQGETPQVMGVNLKGNQLDANYLKWLGQGGGALVNTTQSLNEDIGLGSPTRIEGIRPNWNPFTIGNQLDPDYLNWITGGQPPNLQSNAMDWRDFTGNLGFVGNTNMNYVPSSIPVNTTPLGPRLPTQFEQTMMTQGIPTNQKYFTEDQVWPWLASYKQNPPIVR